ncbi:MAG: helix-turn-helix domain-containing protein [Azonexus sp.]
MLALADWSDDNGKCYPSMSSIAKKVRLSKSQAQRVVHGLIDDGFLKVTANALGGSPTQTRNYRIVLDRLTGSAHATGSVCATGRTHAAEGSHPCGGRGSAHATQTVSEPSTYGWREKTAQCFNAFGAP